MRREIYLTTPMHDYELGDMYSTICLRVYDIVSQLLSIDLTAIGRGLLIKPKIQVACASSPVRAGNAQHIDTDKPELRFVFHCCV